MIEYFVLVTIFMHSHGDTKKGLWSSLWTFWTGIWGAWARNLVLTFMILADKILRVINFRETFFNSFLLLILNDHVQEYSR